MYFSKLFKVKDGKLPQVRAWMDELSTTRKEEARSTFAHENVTREVFVLFEGTDGNHYAMGLNEVNEPYGKTDPEVKINQEHAAFKEECLEAISKKGQVLFDLSQKE